MIDLSNYDNFSLVASMDFEFELMHSPLINCIATKKKSDFFSFLPPSQLQPQIPNNLFCFLLDDSMVHLAGIFHNMYLKLVETEDEHYGKDNGWKFHIHDVNEIPVLGVTTHGTSLYPGQGRDLRLDMKKV